MKQSVAEFLPLVSRPDIKALKVVPVWVRDSHIELLESLLGDVVCRQLLPEALGPELSSLVEFQLEQASDMTVAVVRCVPKLEGWKMSEFAAHGALLCEARILDVLHLPTEVVRKVRGLWLLIALLGQMLDGRQLATNAIEICRRAGGCQLSQPPTFRLGFSVRLPKFSNIESFLGYLLGSGYDLSKVEAVLEKFWKKAEKATEVA